MLGHGKAHLRYRTDAGRGVGVGPAHPRRYQFAARQPASSDHPTSGQRAQETAVAKQLGTSVASVCKWSRRFEQNGLDGLRDKPGRGRKPWLPDKKVQQVISRVTQPPAGRTRWSVRTMAQAVGLSPHAVHTIWKRTDLKPHLTRTFKISTDPQFEQ